VRARATVRAVGLVAVEVRLAGGTAAQWERAGAVKGTLHRRGAAGRDVDGCGLGAVVSK
jgi:hypothetical protein